jgi:phosphoglycerate dehydrogenase-like enzyme
MREAIMSKRLVIAVSTFGRNYLEGRLPGDLDVRWVRDAQDGLDAAREAEVGWFDIFPLEGTLNAVRAGKNLKWVSTFVAGLEDWPLGELKARGIRLTNGSGLHAASCAEYAILGMLAAAKDFPRVLEAQRARNWLIHPPGRMELCESKALIVGFGAIGQAIATRLAAFGVNVTGVRRQGGPGMLGPGDWRQRLGDFDWVILAAPTTAETGKLVGAPELAAMKRGAWLVNMGRGALVDQDALIAALQTGPIGGAYLDVTEPEPLPTDNPLWTMPNVILSMHLSGRAQTRLFEHAAALFLENLEAYRSGKPMRNEVDFTLGY